MSLLTKDCVSAFWFQLIFPSLPTVGCVAIFLLRLIYASLLTVECVSVFLFHLISISLHCEDCLSVFLLPLILLCLLIAGCFCHSVSSSQFVSFFLKTVFLSLCSLYLSCLLVLFTLFGSSYCKQLLCLNLFGPRGDKTCLWWFANNKGADQPAHARSLISAFVIR